MDTALGLLLEQGTVPTSEAVRALVSPVPTEVPDLEAPTVDLAVYDALMPELAGAVQ